MHDRGPQRPKSLGQKTPKLPVCVETLKNSITFGSALQLSKVIHKLCVVLENCGDALGTAHYEGTDSLSL